MIKTILPSIELDVTGKRIPNYADIDILPQSAITPGVPSYITINARIGWEYQHFSIALIGQNLAEEQHTEFGSHETPRSIYAKLIYRL